MQEIDGDARVGIGIIERVDAVAARETVCASA